MMDDLLTLFENFLPVSYAKAHEDEYIQFLFKAARDNYQSGNWQFSYFALHLTFMWYIYTLIWKIKHIDNDRFQLAIKLHDFEKVIKPINGANSPADYNTLPEAQVMHFLRLIIEEESRIKEFKKAVHLRNDLAHCNFLIRVDTVNALQDNLSSVIDKMNEIQSAFNPMLAKLLSNFTQDSTDPENREYTILEDQVREVLVHKNYLSRKDLELIQGLCPKDNDFLSDISKVIKRLYLD